MKKLIVPRRRLLKVAALGIAAPYIGRSDAAPAFGIFQVAAGDPWTALDGRNGAPAGGTIPNSTLLNTYNTGFGGGVNGRYRAVNGSYQVTDSGRRQPPWMVAGVDYYVGITPGTVLQDPSTFNFTVPPYNSNVTYSGNILKIKNAGTLTLDGFDFSLHNGIIVSLIGTGNITISNSNFLNGSSTGTQTALIDWMQNTPTDPQFTGNFTLLNCKIDQAAQTMTASNQTQLILRTGYVGASSSFTMKYCAIYNAIGQSFAMGANSNLLQYNYLEGLNWTSSAHGEWSTFYSNNAANTIALQEFSYNCFNTLKTFGGGGTACLYASSGAPDGAVMGTHQVDHNTFVILPFEYTASIASGTPATMTISANTSNQTPGINNVGGVGVASGTRTTSVNTSPPLGNYNININQSVPSRTMASPCINTCVEYAYETINTIILDSNFCDTTGCNGAPEASWNGTSWSSGPLFVDAGGGGTRPSPTKTTNINMNDGSQY
jgi:hypothetical protein